MTYKLYIDVLFLINFIMDYLLLFTLGKVMKLKSTALRIALSSLIGALWACFIILFPYIPRTLEIAATCIGISSLMVKTAFRIKGIRKLIQSVIGLYFCAVTLGGIIYALYDNTRAGYYVEQLIRGNVSEAMPAAVWILLAAGAYFGAKYIFLTVFEVRHRKKHLYQVTLHYRGKVKTVTALMDTGNHLHDPVSNKPVHVITYEACRQLCESVNSLIYIPFQAVGTQGGILPGIWLDAMEVEQDGEIKTVDKPLIAIYKQPVSADGTYQMLLNEELE